MRAALALLFVAFFGGVAVAALPPKPADYVEDTAALLSPADRATLAAQLAEFERETSNQVLVATFPRVPDDYAMEDFTQRTAEAWGVGRKEHDNGAVFFVFPEDRQMRIEVGYGLEGAIPDATAKSILDEAVTPAFRAGDFSGGVRRGTEAILQAARGEYEGTGHTVAEGASDEDALAGVIFLVVIIVVFLLLIRAARGRGRNWDYSGGGLTGNSGGWSSGGGGWSSGGGGFSGGGGSFGGGGASGSW